MVQFRGISSSEGYAVSKAFIYRHDKLIISHDFINPADIDKETAFLDSTFSSLIAEYKESLRNAVDDTEKALYSVEILMLEDAEYRKAIRKIIREKLYCAPWAVEEATEEIIEKIKGIGDEYIKERIIDIRDIEYVILETLSGKRRGRIVIPDKRILVADYILTSELLALEGLENVEAIVLDSGGKASHISVLAKSNRIPSVVGVENFSLSAEEGELLVVDAYEARVIKKPSKKVINEYDAKIKALREAHESFDASKGATGDDHPVTLDANIEWLEGIGDAIRAGCENIGLFRTEFIAIKEGMLSSDSNGEIYAEAARRMAGRGHVVFRTLDIGGDKKSDGMSEEESPLGWRAVRYMLRHKTEFKAQIKAILMASRYRNVRMMFPLISGLEELDEVLLLLEEVKKELREKKIDFDEGMKTGIMIEVPSAALISDLLARRVDFFSIGTNDLIQYTIVADRDNEKTNYLYDPLHPALLRLIKSVVENAHSAGIQVGICGQMASEKLYTPILVGLGVDEMSMSPSSLPVIRKYLSSLTFDDCSRLVNEVLSETSHAVIEKMVKEFLNERETRNQE